MSVPEKVPMSRMPPLSTGAISTATAAPRGPAGLSAAAGDAG